MSAKSLYFESKQSEESDDRSSVSSIPWNVDAIKQNQMNWEQVERLLHFEEALPDDLEPELRQEIFDWQTKFPQLSKTLKRKTWQTDDTPQMSFNNSSTNISEILDFSSSLDDGNDSDNEDEITQKFDDEFLEPAKAPQLRDKFRFVSKRAAAETKFELADIFGKDLHITPLTLRQRRSARMLEQRKSSTTSTQSDSPVPAKTIKYRNQLPPEQLVLATNNAETKTKSRYHMPPILNVLETKRRFCALNNNRSFVQLTQVQQAKSAAVHSTARRTEPTERRYHVWNKPLAAVHVNSRFFNNRHAIVLPALRQQQSTTGNSTGVGNVVGVTNREMNYFSNSNSTLSSGDIRGRQKMHMMHSGRQATTTTTTSSGRSISAVPMHMHGAFYHL